MKTDKRLELAVDVEASESGRVAGLQNTRFVLGHRGLARSPTARLELVRPRHVYVIHVTQRVHLVARRCALLALVTWLWLWLWLGGERHFDGAEDKRLRGVRLLATYCHRVLSLDESEVIVGVVELRSGDDEYE